MGRSKDQDLIDDLARWLNAPDEATTKTNGHAKAPATLSGPGPSDEAIIEKCRSKKDAEAFSRLFDHGDMSAQGDDASSADYALLRHLKYFTQDPDQLDRIMRMSALRRPKWDKGRVGQTWLRYSIDNALRDIDKIYDWGSSRSRPLAAHEYNHHPTPLGRNDDDYIHLEALLEKKLCWFHRRPDPPPRRFIIEKVARKNYPLVIYGAGGVAKSFGALDCGVAIAGDHHKWLGLQVLEHGLVLYLDFELDVDEQHTRVKELCKGRGVPVPEKLAYISGKGMARQEAFALAHYFAKKNSPVAVIIDSVMQASTGDTDKNKDVNEFYRDYVEPLEALGTTPILVDHSGKLQAGEKQKDKAPIGASSKTNNARGVLQFIMEEYDKETRTLDIRCSVFKTNFEPPPPFGISITFDADSVSIKTRELPTTELVDEAREPLHKRIYAALSLEPLSVVDLSTATGAEVGSVRNSLSTKLMVPGGGVTATEGRPKLYYRLDGPKPPGNEYNHHPTPLGGSGDDYTSGEGGTLLDEQVDDPSTVAEVLGNPPGWLLPAIAGYQEDSFRWETSLCMGVATALGHNTITDELRGEVERILEEGELV